MDFGFKTLFNFSIITMAIEHEKCINTTCVNKVNSKEDDLCRDCWKELTVSDSKKSFSKVMDEAIANKTHSVYMMYYEDDREEEENRVKLKVGYSQKLNARVTRLLSQFRKNRLVYFREFTKESDARLFEKYLKRLDAEEQAGIISDFQDKVKRVQDATLPKL